MGIKRKNRVSIRNLLEKGAEEGVYPGAVLLVAQKNEIVFFEQTGNRARLPETLPMEKDTPFDLASLTKPLATTLSIMKLFDQGTVHPDQTLGDLLRMPVPPDKAAITLRCLLTHCAGFLDWAPFYLELSDEKPKERKTFLRDKLLKIPLKYATGKQTVYSDPGFMILEWVIEKNAGVSLPRFLNEHFLAPLSLEKALFFGTTNPQRNKIEFAATEDCPWRKRILQGEVHDENACALGGYSGHAGIFGTADGVYRLANLLKDHFHGLRDDYLQPETVRTFFEKQHLVPSSTWALGWDTPSPVGSSAGRYFSSNSVGHLGFTGTSLWMDLHHDVTVVLLTNRIHPLRQNTAIKTFRPKLHNLVMEQLGVNPTGAVKTKEPETI
ncbi:MAG: beta-lactamase family protein [Deltaproteobacteria bacterium]|nr:beta-lactamase family protein [Deltaproteobacteria bacterium]